MTHPSHIVDVLRHRATLHGERTAYTFLSRGEEPAGTLTYDALDVRARAIAARLRAKYKGQDRALLVYPAGLEFIEAFFGCLYAGLIAVPAYVQRSSRHARSRLDAISRDCSAQVVLSTRRQLGELDETESAKFSGMDTLATDDVADDSAAAWADVAINPDDVALLQYSSGSTASPKGVIVSHGNVYANQRMIEAAFGHTEASTFVGWLPFFHDMGLFGNIIQPLFIGAHSVLMSPASFLQKPVRWLRAISEYRAHTSGSPNFGYAYCAERISEAEKAGLDLSCWKRAFNGAEKPRTDTMRRFAEAFAPSGFRERAFYPCYGLAEAVLLVTGRNTAIQPDIVEARPAAASPCADAHIGLAHVSSGHTWFEQYVVVVDPETQTRRADGEVGEIWVRGPHVAKGYWNQPALTATTFDASLADTGEGPFLRTGDLGFLKGGELYVVGRLKDLIIVRGQNLYPEDVEAVVERCHPDLGPGRSAAFGIETEQDGTERLVVVAEVSRDVSDDAKLQDLCDAAVAAVSQTFNVAIDQLIFLRKGTLPKTSSGKIQRFRCREAFQKQEFQDVTIARYAGKTPASYIARASLREEAGGVDRAARRASIEGHLLGRVCALLGDRRDRIDRQASLAQHGIDSVKVVELSQWIEETTGVSVAIAELFEAASIDEIVDLIASRLAGVGGPDAPADASVVSSLSYGQRALFFEYERDPSSSAYLVSVALRLHGNVDIDRLDRAVSSLLRRHPVLCVTLSRRGSEPWPEVSVRRPKLLVIEAAAYSEETLHACLGEEANAPLRLDESCVRFVLYAGRETSALLIVVHHVLIDLLSVPVLLRDLARAYSLDDQRVDEEEAQDNERTPFNQFVAWQQHFVLSAAGKRSQQFWQTALARRIESPRLPSIPSSQPNSQKSGMVHRCAIDRRLTAAIRALAERENLTTSMVLLSVYAILLSRFGRVDGVTVGMSAAGRPRAFSNTIGYFANILPLSIQVDAQGSFRALAGQVKTAVARALDHQHYPFSLMIEQLDPGRRSEKSPLVRYAFTFAHAEDDTALLGTLHDGDGLQIPFGPIVATSIPLQRQVAPFDLTLMVLDRERHLEMSFSYSANVLEADAVSSLAGAFEAWLESVVNDGGIRLSRLASGSGRGVERLLTESSAAPVPVISRVDRHAAARPDAIALVSDDLHVSYRELDRRSGRVANRLRRESVGPEDVVAVYCPRGIEMIVAILGIAKAGACYLPVDTIHPAARLNAIAGHARAKMLLTVAAHAHACRERPTILLDTEWTDADARYAPSIAADLDNLAYIIYTSGSTAAPKGVAVTARNLARLFDATRHAIDCGVDDVWVLFHSISFDFAVWEVWGALSTGGRLTILDHASTRRPDVVHRHLIDEQVTVLNQTPSAFYNLLSPLARSSQRDVPALRHVVLGGEALKYDMLRPWFEHAVSNHARLINMYGITETTVHATWRLVRREHVQHSGASVIGQALDDLSLHVLTGDLQELPPYAVGELGVSGPSLARGYVGQAALTAARFVPNPFAASPGSRLYLSGDLGYRGRGDSDFRYVGRLDDQVKIRGHRIEPTEIEQNVRTCEGVRWTAVLPTHEPDGGTVLVAYLVCDNDVTAAAVRSHLARLVPDFMVPSRFVRLDVVPTNENGKVDLAALQACGCELETGLPYAAPRSKAESDLAQIWAEVLQHQRVGIDDNYFELGGDSIRSIQVVSRAKQIGMSLELPQLLLKQTIRAIFDSAAEQRPSGASWSKPFELVTDDDRRRLPAGLDDAFPISFLLQGLMFHSQVSDDYQIYATTMHVRAAWEPVQLEQAIGATVNRHAFLRSSFETVSYREPLQLVHQHVRPVVTIYDLRDRPPVEQDADLRRWIEQELRTPFEWSRPPLTRWYVHRRTDVSFQLTLCEPYLDGWCVALVLSEVLRTYTGAGLHGRQVAYGDELSQRHFVELERRALHDPDSRAFWSSYLDACPSCRLFNRGRNDAGDDKHGRLTAVVPARAVDGLQRVATRASVPLRTVLLAAHARVVAAFSGSDDVVTGVVLNGRPEEDGGDRVIGNFHNTVPFRLKLAEGESWTAYSARVLSTEATLLPHRRFPFAELRKLCAGRLQFDTLFNFTHFHALDWLRSDSRCMLLDVYASEHTYFPLTVHFNRSVLTSELELILDYDARALSPSDIDRIAASYMAIIDAIASERDISVRATAADLQPWSERVTTKSHIADDAAGNSAGIGSVLTGPVGSRVAAGRHDALHAIILAVTAVYEECLRATHLSAEDSFFAAGGDSLKAMSAASRLRARFPCEISTLDIFEYPEITHLASVIAERLADAKPSRIAETAAAGDAPILSFAQERLWMAEQLCDGAPAYNMPALITIKGPFNTCAFEQSVHEIQRRHAILKTVIREQNGRPTAIFDARLDGGMTRIDCSDLTEAMQGDIAARCLTRHARARFDLSREAPIRIALISIRGEQHLLIVVHHIAADGWSIAVLIRELLELYRSYSRGIPAHLPNVTIQYGDYARRERALLGDADRDRLMEYWVRTLEGMPATVHLPRDYHRPRVNDFRGARHNFVVAEDVADSLREACRREGVTLFTVLLAAYTILLYRHSGQTDIVVGMPVSMRDWPDTEHLIGLFVNQLIVRTNLSGEPTVREVLARVQRVLLAAYEHKALPYEQLVAALRPARDTAMLPIVQTLFGYWEHDWKEVAIEGLVLECPEVHNGAAKYELEVELVEGRDGGLHGYFEYNVHLFTSATIDRLASEYAAILQRFAVTLDDRIPPPPHAAIERDAERWDAVEPVG